MSFMFNPFPYHDPNAANELNVDERYTKAITKGNVAAAKAVAARLSGMKRAVVGIDGAISAPFIEWVTALEQALSTAGIPVTSVSAECLYKDADALEEQLKEFLPEDLEKDPVLLFGRLYEGGYEGLMRGDAIDGLAGRMQSFGKNGSGVLIVYGNGALIPALRAHADIKMFIDVTPLTITLNVRGGRVRNLGDRTARPFKLAMRRCYYVDFEVSYHLRGQLLRGGHIDYYLSGDDSDNLQLMPIETVNAIFDALVSQPLRCKPVYLEGVWGGYYFKKIRGLPDTMKNCAWVFDMIPMEVSVVTRQNGVQTEFPYFTFVQARGEALMGAQCVKKFGGYFPVRFNYDDTWHSSGNMSIQVHPGGDYAVANFNELGRQDESYYVVVTGQGAKTYLGFKEDADIEQFIADARRSEQNNEPVDYERYLNFVPSKPGTQVMIPGGTIHSSGRNQVVLEIGSLTIGSYTYKMYDYLRADLDGIPRPIHTYHGDRVLRRERRAGWVRDNIAHEPRSVRKGDGWEEVIVGEHDLLYFSLRNLRFERRIEDDTRDRFHVLTLVDGERVVIRSLTDPSRFFVQRYLDIVVVPASFGRYEIINESDGPVVVHKTLLKQGYEHDTR